MKRRAQHDHQPCELAVVTVVSTVLSRWFLSQKFKNHFKIKQAKRRMLLERSTLGLPRNRDMFWRKVCRSEVYEIWGYLQSSCFWFLGFKWQKQLIFRTKLTMHTAYDRQDNSDPASVTSIAISRDHRTVLVGDARGRVHSWSINDVSGRSIADHWLKDDTTESCTKCRVRFSLTERRHHCRNCGHVFCSRCSRYESEIMQLRIRRPVRVCQDCYASLKSGNEATY